MPVFIGMSAHTALHLSNLEMALHDSMCSSLNHSFTIGAFNGTGVTKEDKSARGSVMAHFME